MLSAVLFTGCTVVITPEAPEARGQIAANLRANIGVSTLKVANNQFEASDEVGLYMKRAGQALAIPSVYSNADNLRMSLSGQDLVSDPPVMYPESDNVDFIAYYPYTALVSSDYTIDVNVTGQALGLPTEVLYSNNVRNQVPTPQPVTLEFQYSFAKLEITVIGGENSPLIEDDFEFMTASINGMFTQAKLQLTNGEVTNRQEKETITLYKISNNATSTTFEALVLPHMVADGEISFVFNAGGVNFQHKQTVSYDSHSLYKHTFALNFSPQPMAVLLNTIILPRDEHSNEIIPVDPMPELFFLDISEETDWDYMLLGSDGSSIFFNVNENTNVPTLLFLKPFMNSNNGYTFLFKENGLPDKMIFEDHILYFGNFRDNLFDLAIIYPNNTVEYFYDIETDVDWEEYFVGIQRLNLLKDISKTLKIVKHVVGVGTCVATPFFPPAGWACGSYVIGVLGDIAIDLLIPEGNWVHDFGHILMDVIGCAGGGITGPIDCASALAGTVSLLSYLDLDLANQKDAVIIEAAVQINTPRISIITHPETPINVTVNHIDARLSASANVTHFATLSYQWYSNTTNSNSGGTPISGATTSNLNIPTTLTVGTHYFFVEARATDGAAPVRSSVATVNVHLIDVITISHPAANTNVSHGRITGSLNVGASVPGGLTLSFQWYSNSIDSNVGGTPISGATSDNFTIPTTLALGTYYYFAEISAPGGIGVSPERSNVATVNVSDRLYIDAIGATQIVQSGTPLIEYTNQTTLGSPGATTWVRVSGTRTASGRITIQGNVHIILMDDSHLNASNGGINVASAYSLNIYSQSMGANMGKLTANGTNGTNGGNAQRGGGGRGGDAGIGGSGGSPNHDSGGSRGNDAGAIFNNGGEITARGGTGGNGGSGWAGGAGGAGAGIGGGGGGGGAATAGLGSNGKSGGSGGSGVAVIVNGGTVIAYWGAAGNGGARNGGNGGGGGGGRGSGIGGAGGGGGGGGYSAGGSGSAGNGSAAGSTHIGTGFSGGGGGKGGSTLGISGTNGGSGGSGGGGISPSHIDNNQTSSRRITRSNNTDHVRIVATYQ